MIQVLLVTICLAVFPYQGSSIILESGNVNDYEVVYPRKVTALPKGAIQQKYEDATQYEFKVNGEPVVLHLEKNKGLFAEDYSETHYSPDGREITTYPPVEDHCYYHGCIENDADSTASISACNGLKAIDFDGTTIGRANIDGICDLKHSVGIVQISRKKRIPVIYFYSRENSHTDKMSLQIKFLLISDPCHFHPYLFVDLTSPGPASTDGILAQCILDIL